MLCFRYWCIYNIQFKLHRKRNTNIIPFFPSNSFVRGYLFFHQNHLTHSALTIQIEKFQHLFFLWSHSFYVLFLYEKFFFFVGCIIIYLQSETIFFSWEKEIKFEGGQSFSFHIMKENLFLLLRGCFLTHITYTKYTIYISRNSLNYRK